MRNRGILFGVLALMLLAGTAALAEDRLVIPRGIDAFTTTANGKTFYDFARNPIPAGFFCDRSAAFTGRIAFKGLPLATAVPGQLRGRDTVIERLDDATFNARGTAVTRIRFRALSLVSISPLRTACGSYHVYVTLGGEQRVTNMSIHRTQAGGGTFVAPLAVNARLTFIPVKPAKGKSPQKLELTGNFTFPATTLPWSLRGGEKAPQVTSAMVDTNGDLAPDTLVRGTSNFWPGWTPGGPSKASEKYFECYYQTICEPESCHEDPSTGKEHCTGPIYSCYACP